MWSEPAFQRLLSRTRTPCRCTSCVLLLIGPPTGLTTLWGRSTEEKNEMPNFKQIDDKNSVVLPSVAQMRKSQADGQTGEGMNETDCRELNATQGHQADIREFTDAGKRCGIIQRGMMNGDPALTKTL